MKKDDKAPKIMGLPEFISRFVTEGQCKEHLFNKRFADGFVSPNCGHVRGIKIASRMLMQCSKCHHQVSATVGTMMHDTKAPICKWYLPIYLITISKRGMSSKELQRQITIHGFGSCVNLRTGLLEENG